MRILFSSHVYAPSVGGIETVSRLLASEFVRQGHEVALVTQTPSATAARAEDFAIHRRPSAARLLELTRWCEVCFHNNISLPKAWPLMLVRRPWVVANHVWIPESGLAARMKRYALRYATGISISHAVAVHLSTPSTVIPNPYDDSMFRVMPEVERDRDLVFLGRLVSDKGAEVLLAAVAALSARGLTPTVTIVGSGPEEAALRAQAHASRLGAWVDFAGVQRGTDLVRLLNRHRILVVPSRWQEPFGVVALEGIASGCVAVGSNVGGLPDAIGSCGETFENGNAAALASVLERLLRDPARCAELRSGAERHLRRHSRESVAAAYLQVFAQVLEAPVSPSGARRISDV